MTTEREDQAAAEWAEHQMRLDSGSTTARRGAAAARHGAAAPERAMGGRPSIDPAAGPGQHARKRQVRLPAEVDRQLAAVATAQHRSTSEIMREALTQYLRAFAAGGAALRGAAGPIGEPHGEEGVVMAKKDMEL